MVKCVIATGLYGNGIGSVRIDRRNGIGPTALGLGRWCVLRFRWWYRRAGLLWGGSIGPAVLRYRPPS